MAFIVKKYRRTHSAAKKILTEIGVHIHKYDRSPSKRDYLGGRKERALFAQIENPAALVRAISYTPVFVIVHRCTPV